MSDQNITVGSAHVDLGEAFRDSARTQIRAVAAKYLGDLTMAGVHVAREGISYRCSVTMQMGALNTMVAEATGKEVPVAFRAALSKVEKQLRRTKRALREDKLQLPDRMATA
ncbi:HPF/RaiA family ribosome-associated protein [Enterovirga sp.]|jgi:ribosomal subunit interface protein|uniref:HPF/RaiA family ribosome-associated protein n=1 Tax=Enterovirga sp. TaxID=2026350 RepID=UPI002636DAF7|nr:HPF/RaiA family ribosome-associated protein [Enterovirga sp.]MDB5591206.1 ribosomal subunit interface protein [Enterovirga sp.]